MSETTDQKKDISRAFIDNKLTIGRVLSMSKTSYQDKYPGNHVLFNANIFVLGEGKVWYGDIDITRDFDALHNIAVQIGKTLFILREMDGRFENESLPDEEITKKAAAKINP